MTSKKESSKIKKLLNKKDKDQNTPLDLAIMNGNSEYVRILLDSGADFESKSKSNALHYCSR